MMLNLKDNLSDPLLLDLFWEEDLFRSVSKKLFFKELIRLTSLTEFAVFEEKWRALEDKIAKQEVIKLLARKGYLSDELRQKLALKQFSDEAIAHAISFGKQGGYVNDDVEIERIVRRSLRKGKGPQAVLHQLKQKRVSGELLKDIRTPLFEQEKRALEEWVRKKYGSMDFADRQKRQKIIAQLMRRGFSSEAIFSTLNSDESLFD